MRKQAHLDRKVQKDHSRRLARCRFIVALMTGTIVALGETPSASADTVVFINDAGQVLYQKAPSLPQAESWGMQRCRSLNIPGCRIFHESQPETGGYGAIVSDDTGKTVVASTGQGSQAAAESVALRACEARAHARCSVNTGWFDANY